MAIVLRGYAKGKDGSLLPIGTMGVPHSKDKQTTREREDRRVLVRRGATIFKREISPSKKTVTTTKNAHR
jgi:hypothetical protein